MAQGHQSQTGPIKGSLAFSVKSWQTSRKRASLCKRRWGQEIRLWSTSAGDYIVIYWLPKGKIKNVRKENHPWEGSLPGPWQNCCQTNLDVLLYHAHWGQSVQSIDLFWRSIEIHREEETHQPLTSSTKFVHPPVQNLSSTCCRWVWGAWWGASFSLATVTCFLPALWHKFL